MSNSPSTSPNPKRPKQEHKGPARGNGKHAGITHTQASQIIAKFGGEAALAKALGINRATPYRWGYARPYGTGGVIPVGMVEKIQVAARREGIVLLPEDWHPNRVTPNNPTPSALGATTEE